MRTYPILLTLFALHIAISVSSAHAAGEIEAKQLYVQSLAATCANCHGTEGHALSGATVPGLAGHSADELVAQMKAFRSGERKATIMHQIAKGFSESQTQLLAEYFAGQKR